MRALAKDQAERFATAGEMADALEAVRVSTCSVSEDGIEMVYEENPMR